MFSNSSQILNYIINILYVSCELFDFVDKLLDDSLSDIEGLPDNEDEDPKFMLHKNQATADSSDSGEEEEIEDRNIDLPFVPRMGRNVE